MKVNRYNPGRKTAAVILLCILAMVFLSGILALVYLQGFGAFSNGYEASRQQMLRELGERSINNIRNQYFDYGYRGPDIYPGTNLRYSVTLEDGTELYSNEENEPFLWAGSMTVRVPDDWSAPTSQAEEGVIQYYETTSLPMVTPTPVPTVMPTPVPVQTQVPSLSAEVTPTPVPTPTPAPAEDGMLSEDTAAAQEKPRSAVIHAYVREELAEHDEFSFRVNLFNLFYRLRYVAVAAVILSTALGMFLYVWLLKAAGHRGSDGSVSTGTVERIPFDLFAALCFCGLCIPFAALGGGVPWNLLGYLILAAATLAAGFIFLLFSMSTAVRIKTHTLWSSCLVVRLLRWIAVLLRRLGSALSKGIRSLPMIRRDLLIVLAVWLLEWLLLCLFIPYERGDITAVMLLKAVVLLPAICWILLGTRRLRTGAKALAAGELSTKVSTERLTPELKEHAEDLNRIADGMNAAVEERLKSERLRTELITNVSHDIKTPLTSIINYVDLLEKTEPEDETTREYLDVLSRQSAKLKKLIEDLIEASKASTGNLPVFPEPCDLTVLLQQMVGEYTERMQDAELIPVVTCPEESIVIMADGRHMWRIMDNLLNNICKYAQSGTRVYLDLKKDGNHAVLSFRNISREPLTATAQELTERFTRGDSSRSTEGNGLGLSIADSLTKLQNGEMQVVLDGDLFKILLEFPLLQEDQIRTTKMATL